EAAGITRVVIGARVHGVVMVLGVGRIDGDEGEWPPILPAFEACRPNARSLGERRGRERMRDGVGIERDEAHRLFAAERAQALAHLRAGKALGARQASSSTSIVEK